MIDTDAISRRYEAVRSALTERGRRLFAAAEAMTAGYGGVTAVSAVTGVARSTINRGIAEWSCPGFVEVYGFGRAGGRCFLS